MATLAPTLTPARPKHKSTLKNCLRSTYSHVRHSAHRAQGLQLSHRGVYSIKRLNAFDEYCRTASRLRVFCVCLVIPLPALLVAIGIECVPLQNPAKGCQSWRVHSRRVGAFPHQLRRVHTNETIDTDSLAVHEASRPDLRICNGFHAFASNFGRRDVYPIPFGYAVGTIPHGTVFSLCFIAGVGRKQLREKPELLGELWNQAIVIVSLVSCV